MSFGVGHPELNGLHPDGLRIWTTSRTGSIFWVRHCAQFEHLGAISSRAESRFIVGA